MVSGLCTKVATVRGDVRGAAIEDGADSDAGGLRGAETSRDTEAIEGCLDITGAVKDACDPISDACDPISDARSGNVVVDIGISMEPTVEDGGLLMGVVPIGSCPVPTIDPVPIRDPLLPRTRVATSMMTSAAQFLTSSSGSSKRLTICMIAP
jgi:hypothetical protein